MDCQNALGSLAGFANLQEIGLQLREHAAYDAGVAAFLRSNLGDWRRPLSLPSDIFDDIAVRTALYEERGLNLGLTAFPPEAFREGLSIAGLHRPPPPFVEPYFVGAGAAAEPPEEEIGFQRTNDAHDRLLRFETHVRKFIDERMTDAFGADWVKHRLPAPMREQWLKKKQVAQQAGSNHPLIAYADFGDYVQIITQADCWRVAFKSVFGRLEMVKESFQRLYPIRLCTMHARIITQDDELYLLVETKRLLKAIGAEA